MANSIWLRCLGCGNWYYVEKKGLVGRLFRSIKITNEKSVESGGEVGETVGMKCFGEKVAHANILNPLNNLEHVGQMFMGDKFRFRVVVVEMSLEQTMKTMI